MKKIMLLMGLILIVSACKKPEDAIIDNDIPIDVEPELVETYDNAFVEGRVTDQDGNALSGVKVYFGDRVSYTDGNGYYQIAELSQGKNKRIWFEKENYVSTQKLVKAVNWEYANANASLFRVAETFTVGTDGKDLATSEFEISFPENAFRDRYGNDISGNVTVTATPFLTSFDEFMGAFPGNFEGRRNNDEIVPIESYGFMDVECTYNGDKAFIKDGKEVELKIKAPDDAPATIPLWYYDEHKGEWIEDGEATLVGDFYVGNVSHFTKWNWDLPKEEISYLTGYVVDEEGRPFKHCIVSAIGEDYIFGDRFYTGESGTFTLRVIPEGTCRMELIYENYYHDLSGSPLSNLKIDVGPMQTKDIGRIVFNLSQAEELGPMLSEEHNNGGIYLRPGEKTYLWGRFFEKEKENITVVLDGNKEIEVDNLVQESWEQDSLFFLYQQIEFIVPNDIKEEGMLQIRNTSKISEEYDYIKAK